jgi:hydroxylysine kinase
MTNDLETFMATMVSHAASVSPEFAAQRVREHYGLEVSAERLTGERDENFRVVARHGGEFVFKIANAAEEPEVTDLQIAALLHVERADPRLPCPRVRLDLEGRSQIHFDDESGARRTARLVTYLPGKPLRTAARSPEQRRACGRFSAGMALALRDFRHPASRRALVWDLHSIPRLGGLLADLPDLPHAAFIGEFIARFGAEVAPKLRGVRHQFLHNDFNNRNILVDPRDESRVTGIIDFGDALHTAVAADVAIAATAQITDAGTMGEAVTDLLRGYYEIQPLEDDELEILNWLIAGRIVMSVLIHSWHRARNPGAEHFPPVDAEHIAHRLELATRLMATPVEAP